MSSESENLEDIGQELGAINLKLTAIDLHLQMIDRNIERLVQLCRLINGQLPTDPDE